MRSGSATAGPAWTCRTSATGRARTGWRRLRARAATTRTGAAGPARTGSCLQIQKAIELAGRVRELGAALLSAYEKGDAEYLASIRAEQEREMQALGIAIRQDQWRDADWQVQALQQTKDLSQADLIYYANLYQNGLINDEIQNLDLTTNALQTRTGANDDRGRGRDHEHHPRLLRRGHVERQPGSDRHQAGPRLRGHRQDHADGRGHTKHHRRDGPDAGGLAAPRGRVVRTRCRCCPIEIQQAELQILGAHRRRDQALQELNNQQRQIEHATEVLDFLRDKFTATDLYLWLQKETAALYSPDVRAGPPGRAGGRAVLQLRAAATPPRRFVPEETWDNLHAGLMAGERLDARVHHMEKAYLDENRRELELTKHFSLRLRLPGRVPASCAPPAAARSTSRSGCSTSTTPATTCAGSRSVSLTVPCVTGPYTGVHCRLTLLSSMTRITPEVRAARAALLLRRRPRAATTSRASTIRASSTSTLRAKSIATSSGQNDSGLFELSFRDERYLPFEYQGAVSRWRIELPPENNYFDLDTLTDVVLHLNYTAREGGTALREAAAQRRPGTAARRRAAAIRRAPRLLRRVAGAARARPLG